MLKLLAISVSDWFSSVGAALSSAGEAIYKAFEEVFFFLCGIFNNSVISSPTGSGNKLEISLLVIILVAMGIFFTIRTKFLQVRHFPNMVRTVT